MTRPISEILSLPAEEKRKELRRLFPVDKVNKGLLETLHKREGGKQFSSAGKFRDHLTIAELTMAARAIHEHNVTPFNIALAMLDRRLEHQDCLHPVFYPVVEGNEPKWDEKFTRENSTSKDFALAPDSVCDPVDVPHLGLIDTALESVGKPKLNDLLALLQDARNKASKAKVTVASTEITTKASGPIPSGRTKLFNANDIFPIPSEAKSGFDFEVPVWEWDGDHPYVPVRDDNYIFRAKELFSVLYALLTNQRCYLQGDTGTGKTTLIEQVAAHLNWPFRRVNFDSEITRMDLIGRDVLTNEGGTTTSKFVDGILPQMLSGPFIGCFDELDFVRPDVAYTMQAVLEGNGLLMNEDGGRIVHPHRMFRMFATANTVGQGDEKGMYQGARPQSMAMLDRFTVWVNVDYLSAEERMTLMRNKVANITDTMANALNSYVGEHIEAFKTGKIFQPISPRGFLATAECISYFNALMPDEREATRFAIENTILNRSTEQDRAVLNGIVDRCFA
jgi:cobaltochelatase CobS